MTTEQNDFRGEHTPPTPPPPAPAAPVGTPPAQYAQPAVSGPSSGGTSGTTAIVVLTAVVGGIALLGSGGAAAAAAAGDLISSSRPGSTQTIDMDGISGIDLDVDASDMRIEFGDVDEAELAITNGRGPAWTFETDGDELIVRSPDTWGWWFGNWFEDDEIAVLTLPEGLSDGSLDGDLRLDAGSLDVVGEFHHLGVEVNAGALDVEGAAESLDVDMSAGRADIMLDGVDEAVLGVAAGDLNVELTGAPPSQTLIDVSAGSVDLTVPDVSYLITQDVSAGSLNAKVDQSGSGNRTIDVSLSAGSATIRPGR
ncbi:MULTISPECIES: DUF4097 family beta strand repeat-containing protein [unclassified Microbacterium]|uniref:DUF4097 family beta strand repeat-containing protein n=1 Tax=unclassified Microbacterium TaxID=2609290 RepID=UPI000EA87396|nr:MULTISPECIES: DUF4097 family beta strand repeat-containing protein [unclassified Microbacterium]MBT2484067.1 hypothetical protein [Microbacterium sp. ISL-108]RKN67021.1 hypothetical protein D7252_05075 [Microbacterium sp. CGR2]